MIDEILDRWYKRKWFKSRVEKFFYYHSPLEKVYWFELLIIVVSTYFIIRGHFLVMSLIYFFRLYLYAMSKYSEKLYPVQIQKYNSLLRRSIYNGAEIIIFVSFMILSYNLNEYAVFGISVMAMSMYFFYQLFDFNGNKKTLMQVRGDYLFIVAIGFMISRVDYLMLFLIILFGYAMYDFLLKSLNQLKDNPQFQKNRDTLRNKRAQIQKKYNIKQKVKGKTNKKSTKNKKIEGISKKAKVSAKKKQANLKKSIKSTKPLKKNAKAGKKRNKKQ